MIYPTIEATPFPPEVTSTVDAFNWYYNTAVLSWAKPYPYSPTAVFPPYKYEHTEEGVLVRDVFQAFCTAGQKDFHTIEWSEFGDRTIPGSFDEMMIRINRSTNPNMTGNIPLYTCTYAEWETWITGQVHTNAASRPAVIKDRIENYLEAIPNIWHNVLEASGDRYYWDREGFSVSKEMRQFSSYPYWDYSYFTASWHRAHIRNGVFSIQHVIESEQSTAIGMSPIFTALMMLMGGMLLVVNVPVGKRPKIA